MILDLPRFLDAERPYWEELDTVLNHLEYDPHKQLDVDEIRRLHYLYERAASALLRLATFSGEVQTRIFLESLVARAYAECHPNRGMTEHLHPFRWIETTFPETFRKHMTAFVLTAALTVAGAAFGWGAVSFDPNAKAALMPFPQLMQSPEARVRGEESARIDRLAGYRASFSAQLMTHNIQVSLFTFALGATWGIGSGMMLFYNGVILGAVAADYIRAGFAPFLLGWLLPHGVVEIPAILIAGQAGFVLASALIGWRDPVGRRTRLRQRWGDILTLAAGSALLLVWAGIVEAFLSQYHEPALPYSLKIAFGLAELLALTFYLFRAGRV